MIRKPNSARNSTLLSSYSGVGVDKSAAAYEIESALVAHTLWLTLNPISELPEIIAQKGSKTF